MRICVFLAEGFEEIEAVAPIDIFRRAAIEVLTVSVTGNKVIAGAHAIPVLADVLFEDVAFAADDFLFLPGGLPGFIPYVILWVIVPEKGPQSRADSTPEAEVVDDKKK